MISRLTGTIAHIDLKYLIIDVGGVGYKVYTTADVLSGMGKMHKTDKGTGNQTPVTIFTYLAVRDNALDLYGFANTTELYFFELLIGISGIGPKSALGVLNIASVEALDRAIRTGDTTHLIKVSGVSKKVAEKIVLELKDKLGADTHGVNGETEEYAHAIKSEMRKDADALEALKSLGYNANEARDVLKQLDKNIKDTGEKVKAALKLLSQE